MIVAIHQPNFLPWLGYFYKMAKADLFVYADTLAFSKGSYTPRVQIKTHNGPKWMTVSLARDHKGEGRIMDMRCGGPPDWRERLIDTLKGNYTKSPYFKSCIEPIAEIIRTCDDNLAELNIRLSDHLAAQFRISTPTVRASALPPDHLAGQGADWLISVCKEVKADAYLSGFGGAKYQHEESYVRQGIKLVYTDFKHPTYPQAHGEFVAGLSSVDLLFNCGENSRDVLLSRTAG